jgi:hypothetical protein
MRTSFAVFGDNCGLMRRTHRTGAGQRGERRKPSNLLAEWCRNDAQAGALVFVRLLFSVQSRIRVKSATANGMAENSAALAYSVLERSKFRDAVHHPSHILKNLTFSPAAGAPPKTPGRHGRVPVLMRAAPPGVLGLQLNIRVVRFPDRDGTAISRDAAG